METSRRDFFTSLAAGWALATKARVDSKKSFPDFPKGAEVVEYMPHDLNLAIQRGKSSLVAVGEVNEHGKMIRGHGFRYLAKVKAGQIRMQFSNAVAALPTVSMFINVCPVRGDDGVVSFLSTDEREYVQVSTAATSDGMPVASGFFIMVHAVMKA